MRQAAAIQIQDIHSHVISPVQSEFGVSESNTSNSVIEQGSNGAEVNAQTQLPQTIRGWKKEGSEFGESDLLLLAIVESLGLSKVSHFAFKGIEAYVDYQSTNERTKSQPNLTSQSEQPILSWNASSTASLEMLAKKKKANKEKARAQQKFRGIRFN